MPLRGYILPSKRAKIKVFFILFGCSACWIFVPWLGIKPMPLQGKCGVQTSESESHLVMSDFLSPHGILQARILEWVAFPFSWGSSQPRDWTQVSRTAGRFFTSWATGEAQEYWSGLPIPFPVDLPSPGIEPGSLALQILYQLSYQGRLITV